LAQGKQKRRDALGEDGNLRFLDNDRDNLAALDGLKKERSLTGLAHGTRDKSVGWIKGIYAARHVNSEARTATARSSEFLSAARQP
jgi:hypothetical protein